MKTSEFTDKKVTELSRSHSDEFSDLSYSRGRETEDFDDLSFGLSKDDCDSDFQFRHVRPVSSSDSFGPDFQNRTAMDFDHMRAGSKKAGTFNDGGLISLIDHKLEEYSKKLLHAVESLSARLCQLETRTRKIEHSVDELKDSSMFTHRRSEKKLKELENVLTEIQASIQDLRDKQEISEVQIEVTKLQILKDHQKSEEKIKINTSSNQKVPSSVPRQSNQSHSVYNVAPLQQFPSHPSVALTPSHQSLSPPIPPSSGQFPSQSLSQSQLLSPSAPMLSSESSNQRYSIPPVQPTSSLPYQPYQSVQQLPLTSHMQQQPLQYPSHSVVDLQPRHLSPVLQLPLMLQSQQLPLPRPSHNAVDPQACPFPTQNFERIQFMKPQTYNTNIHNTYSAPGLAPPSQQVHFSSRSSEFHPEHVQPSRHSGFHDDRTRFGLPSHYGGPKPVPVSSEFRPLSSVVGSENRFSQPQNQQSLPHALPMASEVSSGSGSGGGTGSSTSIEDVMDNVVAMGFRRDLVRATVKKMTENGQSVDLNIVLDKLMNNGDAQNDNGRYVR